MKLSGFPSESFLSWKYSSILVEIGNSDPAPVMRLVQVSAQGKFTKKNIVKDVSLYSRISVHDNMLNLLYCQATTGNYSLYLLIVCLIYND